MHVRSGSSFVVTSLLLTLAATLGAGQGADKTREANKGGASVVEAVVDLIRSNCIFSEDRLFLRRLAYVESRDGTDVKTYRPGYDGGIWQVDEDKFNATLACGSVLATYCAKISQPPFNINWRSVTWSDLRKPLYSGLAATFYLLQRLGGSTSAIPGDIKNQSILWSQYYRPGIHPSNFENVAGNSTVFDCKRETDLVFVLDSSGSISDSSFALSLNFAARVVEAMKIPEPLRVAALIYASSPVVKFNFSKEQTSSQVAAAIRGIQRVSGGTATDKALDTVRSSLFSNSSSAREGANRVVVLVTDGQSDNTNRTIQAANQLRDEGQAAVFAIGVGGYSLTELKAVATQPKCLHVFTLDDFSIISSIIYEIQRSTCTAHQTIGVGNTNIEVNSTKNTGPFVIPRQEPNKTVMFEVQCGSLDVYVSFTNPKPSPALYSEKYTAWDGRPAYLLTSSTNDGLPVYISVVGTELPPSLAAIQQCTGFTMHIATVDKPWQVRCCNNQVCRQCTNSDLLQQITLFTDVCDTRDLSFPNPCTREALLKGKTIFPYIYDSKKFIRCDYHGNAYLTLCPPGKTFNSGSLSCGSEVSQVSYERPLPATHPNPCTPEKQLAQYFYFEDTPDRQLFIHCDPWGKAWLQTCPALKVWNQELLTCVVGDSLAPTTNRPTTLINPCAPEVLAADCDGPPPTVKRTRVTYSGSKHNDVAYYTCSVTSDVYIKGTTQVYCKNGKWETPTILCAPTTCWYNHPTWGPVYKGTQATTKLGFTCNVWTSDYPHNKGTIYKDDKAYTVDGNKAAANKFCRVFNDNYPHVWCYTTDKSQRWDQCDVPHCDQTQDCDGPPPTVKRTRVTYSGSKHNDVAYYTCSVTSDVYIKGTTQVYCKNGKWETPTILCAPTTCWYNHPTWGPVYKGTQATTKLGFTCNVWTSDYPHNKGTIYKDDKAYTVDGNKAAARNFCRVFNDNYPHVWCYTTDKSQRWDQCDVPHCD